MGQTIGRAALAPEFLAFVNLPKSCVYELWEAFNDVAEGFGLTLNEFQEILRVAIKDYSGLTEERLDELSAQLFRTFDTDKNDLVDSLEFLSSLGVLSGMDVEGKLKFIFGIYDFDESGMLTVDESILAMRATLGGLCKLAGISYPLEAEVENIAVSAFPEDRSSGTDALIDKETFLHYCKKTAEVMSWLEYFGDMDDAAAVMNEKVTPVGAAAKRIVAREEKPEGRSKYDLSAIDADDGALQRLEIEQRGKKLDVAPVEMWRAAAAFTEPAVIDADNSAPNVYMRLRHIFGHNSCYRQIIHYAKPHQRTSRPATDQGPTNSRAAAGVSTNARIVSANGEQADRYSPNERAASGRSIVYPAGAVGVVHDITTGQQTFYIQHTDKITCLRVHRDAAGTTVATGQLGLKARIHVWNPFTLETLAVLRGFHTMGVQCVDFSASGTLLVSVGMDAQHSLAVWNWADKALLFTSPSSMSSVHDARWTSEESLVTCGMHHVHFWAIDRKVLRRTRGIFGKKVAKQAILCVACLNGVVVTGTITGNFLLWDGRNCVRTIKAHSGAITSLYVCTGEFAGLVSASDDGKISIWNQNLELGHGFDMKALGAVEHAVQSVCWDPANQRMLVATTSAEIFEISDFDGTNPHKKPLALGHFHTGVWGLAVHPHNPALVVTVGDDKTVRMWDVEGRRLVKMVILDTPARCCTFSPDGNVLAVGLGTDGSETGGLRKDGAFVILDAVNLTILHEARDSKRCVGDLKFSPDGTVLALGSQDGTVYFYNAADFSCRAKCRGHKGRITHVDFSADGLYVCSNCDGGQALFWDVELCEERAARSMKGVAWKTQSCVYSWSLKSAWGLYDDKTMLTSCTRTQLGSVYATSDWFGRLALWRNPVAGNDPAYIEARGHAPRLAKVEFTIDDSALISVGKGDNCVFVWSVDIEPAGPPAEAQAVEDTVETRLREGRRLREREEKAEDLDAGDLVDRDALEPDENQEAGNEGDMGAVFAMEEHGSEEYFAPTQPWHRIIVAPSKPPPEDNHEPASDVALEWVHGFRAHDCRGTVLYTQPARHIVFFTGAVAVVMDPNNREDKQRFYMEHTDEILSLAVHPEKAVVATGQRGRVPRIHIWDLESMETIIILKGFHRRAVSCLRFSRDGNLLASIGNDTYHSLAVYDWHNGSLVCTTRTVENKTLAVEFMPDGQGLIQCGVGFIRFWSFQGMNASFRNVLIDPSNRRSFPLAQAFTCIGWVGNAPVIGTASGHLWRFSGIQAEGTVRAHTGPVYCIYTTHEGIVTSGKDGFARIWTPTLQPKTVIDMKLRGSVCPIVRSVAWDNDECRVLVATQGNEIFEFSTTDGANLHGNEPLLQGHYASELHGLAPHPSEPEYVTTGDDRMLRIWSVRDRRLKRSFALENPSRAVCYNPDGSMIAVGFGSPLEKPEPGKRLYDGKWVVLDERSLSVLHEARDSTKWVTDMKWSPNGSLLAVGSYDSKIYVYSADSHFALCTTIAQHNAFIKHLDFSANSVYLQATCGAGELCYYEADTGLFIPAASRLKDVIWTTQTCTAGWSVQGIWPPQNDHTDVTSCDVNFATEHGEKVAAVADGYGRLRLFKYPVQSGYAVSRCHHTHGGPLSKVRWVGGDAALVTLSSRDNVVMQWRHNVDDLALAQAMTAGGQAAIMQVDTKDEDAGLYDVEELTRQLAVLETSVAPSDDSISAKTRPWLGSVVEPTNPPPHDAKRPPVDIELVWIHGYTSQLTRNSLAYNANREVVYPAANACVVYDKRAHVQRFFRAHERDVVAMAVAPNRRLMASADRCRRPRIRIWDAQTCTELALLPCYHRLGVAYMSFSADSKRLVSVGMDMDHSIALWHSCTGQWNDAVLLAHSKGDVDTVYFSEFTPATESGYLFASGGHGHIKFWEIKGRNLQARAGVLANVGVMQTMLCGASSTRRFVSGTAAGHMYVWKGRVLDKVIRAHDKAMTCVHSCAAGVVTGSKDGYVKLWGPNFEHLRSYDLQEAPVPPLVPGIRAVHMGLDASHSHVTSILVGTESSEIYEVARDTGSILLLVEGHYHDELWGLAACPTHKDVVATCGDDRTIRLWSLSMRRLLRKALLDSPARCIAWSPDGKVLVAGLGGSSTGVRQKKDGAFVVLNAATLQVVYEGRDCRHWIRDVKFAPNGASFAVAAADNKVYIYNASTYALKGKCDKHNAPVRALDFSSDSALVQSDSVDFEHLYFNALDGGHIRQASQVKDATFDTWTCTFGWPVQGIWPSMESHEVDPSVACRSYDGKLIAVGDEGGALKLFNFPSVARASDNFKVKAHPYGLGNVKWALGDAYVVTVGKKDRAFCVWRVKGGAQQASAE